MKRLVQTVMLIGPLLVGFAYGRYTAPVAAPAYVEVLQSGTTVENLAFHNAALCVRNLEGVTVKGNTFHFEPPRKWLVTDCRIPAAALFDKDSAEQ